jgi:isopenicillin N synthase-like dioxygenase
MRDISLPVIDLSSSRLSDPAARTEETAKLIASFSTAGFCLVSGLEGYDADKLLKWVKWFFLEVTEEERMGQLATKTFVKVK